MKVLLFGELLLRLAAPGYTRLLQKDSLEATFCGGEANVAVSLSNFGINSMFITKLPDNDIGKAAVNSLRYFGVDTSRCFLETEEWDYIIWKKEPRSALQRLYMTENILPFRYLRRMNMTG